ncbi:homoserine O-acetyltransferase [Phytoactinopolyspora alkaliphila]|uniref:Homoserine O-acetyltransferase n=1 Tax=Phytoactinopolyspora alkaliphila TaxID=1783498 RepID=A0A6N9YTF3_9ACTN|nr:homoserine O-acetyltransferase [Phytoactinopolyspora alkaliphila]
MPPRDDPSPPASGAWREGDDAGHRLFAGVGDVKLESGQVIPDVRVAYETWGELNDDASNAVLVQHALTGDSHVVGDQGPGHPSPGWWAGMVGPGAPVDTDRYFVVAPNVLGGCQGTTGPSSAEPGGRRAWGGRFPRTTVRDQVAVEALLADTLGIDAWAGVVGGSMGGMRAVEWGVTWPDRVRSMVLLATCAAASAEQIGLSAAQIHAIRADAGYHGGDYYDAAPGAGPHVGLGIARRIAHITYRSELELQERFGRRPQDGEDPLGGGRFAVESYLDHHARKLVRRFDANSYIVLSEAMNSHDVGRGRGGTEAALARVSARTVVAGIDSDRLYPLWQQELLARHIPSASDVQVITSPFGHDGFLIETGPVGSLVAAALG